MIFKTKYFLIGQIDKAMQHMQRSFKRFRQVLEDTCEQQAQYLDPWPRDWDLLTSVLVHCDNNTSDWPVLSTIMTCNLISVSDCPPRIAKFIKTALLFSTFVSANHSHKDLSGYV